LFRSYKILFLYPMVRDKFRIICIETSMDIYSNIKILLKDRYGDYIKIYSLSMIEFIKELEILVIKVNLNIVKEIKNVLEINNYKYMIVSSIKRSRKLLTKKINEI
ncbi:hypothetical protein SLOPH_590, partial [Spraguea lophii 42_110]